MKTQVKKTLETLKNSRYHWLHRFEAKRILSNLEKTKGKTDRSAIKASNEYAADVLGWSGYAPWLYVYSSLSGSFKEGWIPDNYYGKIVLPAINNKIGEVSDVKTVTNVIFRSESIPDIGCFANGLFFSDQFCVVDDEQIGKYLFSKSDKVVFKIDDSSQGRGVYFFDRESFDPLAVRNLGNGIFQKYIIQHEFFEALVPSSVTTLRITTVLENGGDVSVRACFLRVGRLDDTHVKTTTLVRIPVDPETGDLGPFGYLPTWLSIEKHPDTNYVFSGKTVPEFNACRETVVELHKSMPYVRCIGWDVCVNNDNVVNVMEWNGSHNDIKFSEATQGPCFSDLGWERLWR